MLLLPGIGLVEGVSHNNKAGEGDFVPKALVLRVFICDRARKNQFIPSSLSLALIFSIAFSRSKTLPR